MSRRKRYLRNLGRTLPEPLALRTTTAWIRFEHESEPYGVFSYISDVRPKLSTSEEEELDEILDWFYDELDAPDDGLDHERFWFRAEAEVCVEQARRLAELVRGTGIPIVERRTDRVPGKIKWEDPDQVAVLTYRDAPRP
ncbi:MAG: hypothetical protein AAF799_35040 [Myxococcota bacterium]